jgi:2-amino-4-hydroxy-6-hydroxymethyldihydropteridine diphosphokinase
MRKAILLLGSNSGNRERYLMQAEEQIVKQVGKIVQSSFVYETSPWGFTDQPDFLNKVISIETPLEPIKLLHTLKNIETAAGRIINEKWKERIIDIDILFYDDLIYNSDELTIPHPFIKERKFTLMPLNEIMPEYIHPVLKKTINELLKSCDDEGQVQKLNPTLNLKP